MKKISLMLLASLGLAVVVNAQPGSGFQRREGGSRGQHSPQRQGPDGDRPEFQARIPDSAASEGSAECAPGG